MSHFRISFLFICILAIISLAGNASFSAYARDVEIDSSMKVAFLQAVSQGDILTVNQLLDAHKELINAVDSQGNTALMFAVAYDREQILERLIAAHIKVNATNIGGKTALHYAVDYQRLQMAHRLIKAGVGRRVRDKEGKTALDYAMERNLVELAQAIDPKSVRMEMNEAGLPVAALAAVASGGGAGISTTAVVTGAAVVAGGAGVAVAASGGGGKDDKSAASSSSSQSGGSGNSGSANVPVTPTSGSNSGSSTVKVRVAILDTGVFNHADLSINQALSFNTQTGASDATPPVGTGEIERSHGTMIAGIIAAQKNSSGIDGFDAKEKGIAPNSEIVAIKLPLLDMPEDFELNKRSSFIARQIEAGISYAISPTAGNAPILNHSWGVLDGLIPAYAFDQLGCNGSPPGSAPAFCTDLYQTDPQNPADFVVPNKGLKTFLEEGKKAFDLLPEEERSLDTYQSIRNILDTYKAISATNKIVVWAAGNSGYGEVQMDARLPFVEAATDNSTEFADLKKNWLVVAALSSDENAFYQPSKSLADYSNRCGIAKERCLAAFGDAVAPIEPDARYIIIRNNDTNDTSYKIVEKDYKAGANEEILWDTTGYAFGDGTSFAAPRVSGALALLLEQSKTFRDNPSLAADWLLETADRGFSGYSDELYGQGILDIDKALAPNPAKLMVATGSTTSANTQLFSNTRLILGAATGDALAKEKLSFGIVDMYQRFYRVAFDTPVYHKNIQNRFIAFSEDVLENKQLIGEHMQLAMSAQNPDADPDSTRHRSIAEMEAIHLNNQDRDAQWALSFDNQAVFSAVDYNVAFDKAFGFSALDAQLVNLSASDVVGRNAFLGFADTGMSVMSGYRDASKGRTFKMGGFLYNSADEVKTLTSGKEISNSGMVAEVTQTFGSFSRLGLQLGVLLERNTFLGSYTSGAFSLAQDTPTWFSAVAGEYALTDHTHLFATYSTGISKPSVAEGSLLEDMTSIVSDSFSVGVIQSDVFRGEDQLGINISQPLRVMSGHAGLKLAAYKDWDDALHYTHHTLSLVPSGREIDSEVYYGIALSDDVKLKSSLMYRSEPNHIENAPSETVGLVSVKYMF